MQMGCEVDMGARRRILAACAAAVLVASCGFAPPMTTFEEPSFGFRVDLPSQPERLEVVNQTSDSSPEGQPMRSLRAAVFEAKSLGRDFTVTVMDVDPRRDLDALVEAVAQPLIRGVGGVVTYRTYCSTAEGVLGRELVISQGGRRAIRARFYRSGARLFVVAAKSVMGFNPGEESSGEDRSADSGADTDPAVKAFLSSFHVTSGSKS